MPANYGIDVNLNENCSAGHLSSLHHLDAMGYGYSGVLRLRSILARLYRQLDLLHVVKEELCNSMSGSLIDK